MINLRSKVLARKMRKIPVPALIVNRNRTVRAINGEASRLTGVPAGEAVGKMTCRQVCGCRLPLADCPLNAAFAAGQTRPTQITISPGARRTEVIERIRTFYDAVTGEEQAAIVFVKCARKNAG